MTLRCNELPFEGGRFYGCALQVRVAAPAAGDLKLLLFQRRGTNLTDSSNPTHVNAVPAPSSSNDLNQTLKEQLRTSVGKDPVRAGPFLLTSIIVKFTLVQAYPGKLSMAARSNSQNVEHQYLYVLQKHLFFLDH